MWWTLAASLLGSGTALFIAIVIYPWQKSIDRALDIEMQRREIFKTLLLRLTDLDSFLSSPVPDIAERIRRILDECAIGLRALGNCEQLEEMKELRLLLEHGSFNPDDPDWRSDFSDKARLLSKAIISDCAGAFKPHDGLRQWICRNYLTFLCTRSGNK